MSDVPRRITGTMLAPDGQPITNRTLTWYRANRRTLAQGSSVIVDEVFRTATNALGEVDVSVVPGAYLVMVRLADQDRYFEVGVPEGTGPLQMRDLIDTAAPVLTPPLLIEAQDARDAAIVAADRAENAAAKLPKSRYDATRAPLPTDDETEGYAPGSRWLWQGREWVLSGAGWQERGAADFVVPEASLKRPVVQRLRDSVSALDLMSAGDLDEAIRSREATAADAASITSHMQEAVAACAAKRWRLDIPAGLYHLNARLEADRLIAIRGGGQGAATLRWGSSAASEGFRMLTGSGQASRVTATISDVTLETDKQGTGGAAVTIDGTGQLSGGTLFPRAQTHLQMDRVEIKGADLYNLRGWNRGIDLISCMGANIHNSRLLGYVPVNGEMPISARGVYFGGIGAPVQLVMSGTHVSAFVEGVRVEQAEGVYIQGGCELVNVGVGVVVHSDQIEPLFHFRNSHISAHQKCISLRYAVEGIIADSVLYPYQQVSGDFIGIEVNEGCYSLNITGNDFNRPNSVTQYRCIVLKGGDYTMIDHNRLSPGASSGCTGIDIEAAATNTMIGGMNVFRTANQRIRNASDSTYAREWPGTYGGSLDAIPTSDKMRSQRHICSPTATGGPGALGSLTGCVVETTAFDGNAAVQTLRSPATNDWFQRRKSGGSWTIWITYGPKP